MCGIVGVVAKRNIIPVLLETLRLQEYPGYDAATMLVINENYQMEYHESLNQVAELAKMLALHPFVSNIGVANTNWSRRTKNNKMDMHACIIADKIGLVQHGLIENNENLRTRLLIEGYPVGYTNTDGELIGYLIYHFIKIGQNCLNAIRNAAKEIEGTFTICFIHSDESTSLKVLHRGSTLVIGLGVNENFIASDHTTLLHVAERFIYLEEGDIADITSDNITIYNTIGEQVERQIFTVDRHNKIAKKGKYSHFMLKEIYEQPDAILTTLQGRLNDQRVFVEAFGINAHEFFSRIHRVHIVATGTSFHAGLVSKYWFEKISGIPCQVEMASETSYQERIVEPNTLFITLSDSEESGETLKALRIAKTLGYTATLTISGTSDSYLVKESDLVLITSEGRNENIASIKSFTAQLTGLSLLATALGRYHRLDEASEAILVKKLRSLPIKAKQTLQLNPVIKNIASELTSLQRTFFLGNGIQLPVAMEGAMKLKKIPSIFAEAYPVDEFNQHQFDLTSTAIVALAYPRESIFDVFVPAIHHRVDKLIVFSDEKHEMQDNDRIKTIKLPSIEALFAPITYIIPMQLLAYHIAVMKGADTDIPRYKMEQAIRS